MITYTERTDFLSLHPSSVIVQSAQLRIEFLDIVEELIPLFILVVSTRGGFFEGFGDDLTLVL